MSTTFQTLFAEDKQHLDSALANNLLEQNHLRRCMELAHMVDWRGGGPNPENQRSGNLNSEFGRLLGAEGVAQFEQILERILRLSSDLPNPQLRNPRQFLIHALYIHDLGKYDQALDRFNGTGHEERSAQIVGRQQDNLIAQLGWQTESVALLVGLARFHAILGIVHLGGASMVYLKPLLEWILSLDKRLQRLFLDLLIILNCCDAGASGDFATQQFYLNQGRLVTYMRSADEIMQAIARLERDKDADSQAILLQQATQLPTMVERIQRIVSANNALTVAPDIVEQALSTVIAAGHFDPTGFALTRFDHGTYVFEPLLHRLLSDSEPVSESDALPDTVSGKVSGAVSRDALTKLLHLIGLLSLHNRTVTVVHLRDLYSMKPDLQPQNRARFERLLQAVSSGDSEMIRQTVRAH